MAIQIRITDPDGSNAVILDATDDRKVFKTLNSSDEGASFKVAKNHPKAEILNPDNGGYVRFWEAWDTNTNTRINYGPITEINEAGTEWAVQGTGRSALLNDFIDSRKTFYAGIDEFVNNLRFENVAIEPRTVTLVHNTKVETDQTTVFGTVTVDEKYYGISRGSKDNSIDNQFKLRPGEIEPPNKFYLSTSFWAGMSTNDALIVDLGYVYPISKIQLLLPYWGGIQRLTNRTYDFTLDYANDTEATLTTWKGRKFGPFHNLYDTGANTKENGTFTIDLEDSPTDIRYLRINISDVHAWFGDNFSGTTLVDRYDYQCDPDYSGGVSEGIEISDQTLKPNNDCMAGVMEVAAYKKIIGRDSIKDLALQRIDNNNLQIRYTHTPDAADTKTTSAGFRLYEPGGLFRNATVTYSSASTAYTKFFASDCTDCYPDSFNFGIVDQNNSLIYASDSSSGTVSVRAPVYTRMITMKGASDATVTSVDAWDSIYDPLSWGSGYSYSEVAGDTAICRFRGESFKWYATIPSDKTGGTVNIHIRNKDNTGAWTSWTALETGYVLPNDISSSVVYEITFESGDLAADTVYEIRITNVDGNYVSIDSFEGYWSASMSTYNDDSSRTIQGHPDKMTQIYDGRFNMGSMMKWNDGNGRVQFSFEGDRFIILSAKGRHHGIASLFLANSTGEQSQYGLSDNFVQIPGGTLPNGGIQIDLDTGKRGTEIPQYVAFDSDDYFEDGLPWGRYAVTFALRDDDLESYSANIYDTNNFVQRCENCKTPKGTQTINKYIYFDSILVHERVGLSVSFDNQTHLEMLKSVSEAIQAEWDITDDGIVLTPRIGTDTNIILREGQNTVVDYQIVNDVTKVASMLFSNGADIDGLPLSTVVEDRKNRLTLGRTVMRKEDFRSMADYTQLIGLSRTELKKRRYPEKRITVKHIAESLDLDKGDSFILYTKKMGQLRVRIVRKEISESRGREYNLECIRWPIIQE